MKTRMLTALILLLGIQSVPLHAQLLGTEKKYVRIGQLQSHFSSYGSERAWNNKYYEGLRWPADYSYTDNAVIKRFWLGCSDFTDAEGRYWSKYGIYFAADYVGKSLFPMELKQIAKFPMPHVYVDGNDISAPYQGDVDDINPDQIPDRIVVNVVNTSMGLTIKRIIYAFSQQYHDDYFIKKFVFINTGNTDYDDEIELNTPIKGLRIGWGVRYSVCREGSFYIGGTQSWGQQSWVTRRGETYEDHYQQIITENTPISQLDWLRCGFSWAGQKASNSFDNIGAPDILKTGRLTAPQMAGIVILHVDKSPQDRSDDPEQPVTLGWHAGDTYPKLGDMIDEGQMIKQYTMLSGVPYQGLGGTNRFFEDNTSSITDRVDPSTIHNDGGGTNLWVNYGPFDLAPGDSIVIVEAEGVHGLNRQMCELIGARWKEAKTYPSRSFEFELPDGSSISGTYNDGVADYFKNSWVYTGWDSIMKVFARAKMNYDSGFDIPQPPQPPTKFEVLSGGDRISLKWEPSPSEDQADFGGYRIFRAIGKPDTFYTEIFACGKGTDHPQIVYQFDDTTPQRNHAYYYYITAFNDGSNNDGTLNPPGPLSSSKYYTWATEPAYLQRQAGRSINDVRIVPNPYNIKARELNFTLEPNKIVFMNIPAYCRISIYTERGDLIQILEHTDGSGDESWNMVTKTRQTVVSGIYIAHIEVTKDYYDPQTGELLYRAGDSVVRKFVIIR
ncbi:fibronectin type III domain-containing protein [Caldithrix abyssi]|uniref:Fibronectin type III domain-containing protein n=2 Tax=Caldithrix abyssi DSM 13497 TaxID=880073 RepID=H1XQ90_CALAY|nr:hypothetical protein [Caldithrix abyssi]EHO43395.1 fibronectin type III domain-containing protein [Caldithrix abyssi DSM 13497]